MKKIVNLILVACMILSLFALCACGAESQTDPEPEAQNQEYTLGMGVMINTDSSKENQAQVDATFAGVVLDAEGKIVSCRLDCVQNKMDVTGGAVDTAATFKTKMELGDDYNMVKFSDATIEWYDQAKNFETYVIGKTAAEVEGIETRVNDEGYNVAVDEELFAGCSISIQDFIGAVVKACNDEWAVKFTTADEFTLGVAAISTAAESVAAAADKDADVKMYSEYAAAVVGADGKILACLNDATQPVINVDLNGAITGSDAEKGTKRELGDDYNMVKFGNAIAEWDAQSAAFSEYCVGKTAAEVQGLETIVNEEGHQVTTDETLFASCTMSIGGMMAVIAQAANYAR